MGMHPEAGQPLWPSFFRLGREGPGALRHHGTILRCGGQGLWEGKPNGYSLPPPPAPHVLCHSPKQGKT